MELASGSVALNCPTIMPEVGFPGCYCHSGREWQETDWEGRGVLGLVQEANSSASEKLSLSSSVSKWSSMPSESRSSTILRMETVKFPSVEAFCSSETRTCRVYWVVLDSKSNGATVLSLPSESSVKSSWMVLLLSMREKVRESLYLDRWR